MSVQGIISANQQTNLTGDKLGDALPEAKRAPPWQGHENAAQAAFPRPFGRARLRFGPRAAHVAPFPLVPINTPLGSSVGGDPELEQVV